MTEVPSRPLPAEMRAGVLHARGDLRIERLPRPDPGPAEVLLEIRIAGICGTDAHEFAAGPVMFPLEHRHAVTGHLGPMVIGHELAGTVVAVGTGVDEAWLARDVVTGGGYGCGACRWCRQDRPNLCPAYATAGLSRHGGLAQYCVVPLRSIEDISSRRLSFDVAALAQPMAIAMHARRRGRVQPDEDVAIVGCGGIGAFLVAACADAGARVTAVDLEPERLRVATAMGASHVVQVGPGDDVGSLLDGTPFDVVFEVTGVDNVLDALLGGLPRGTRIVLVGLQDGRLPVAFRPISLRENEIIGTNALVPALDFAPALTLLERDDLDWVLLAPIVLGLDQLVEEGLVPLARGTSPRIKSLIDPWAERVRATQTAEQRGGARAPRTSAEAS